MVDDINIFFATKGALEVQMSSQCAMKFFKRIP